MENPFDGFQRGLMTGAQLGGRMRERQQQREIGGLLQTGDYTGAARAAYGYGDLQTGSALTAMQSQQDERARGGQITDALRGGNYDQALSFASSPEELQAIQRFRETASEQEVAQARQGAERQAQIGYAVRGIADPMQRLARARELAPQFGADPNSITEQSVTDQALDGWIAQAMGLADFLTYQQKEREAQRPIIGNGFVSLPPGTPVPAGMGGGQSLGATLPPGWSINRPNQPPSAPAAGGGERSQPVSVRFSSSNEAQTHIQQLVPGVRITSGRRSVADNRRVGGSPGSFHLQDRARDLVPPPGMSMAQLASRMRQSGFRALDEGDHVHVSW